MNKEEYYIIGEIEDIRELTRNKKLKERINQLHYTFQLYLESKEV